jgi:hypothetical protein
VPFERHAEAGLHNAPRYTGGKNALRVPEGAAKMLRQHAPVQRTRACGRVTRGHDKYLPARLAATGSSGHFERIRCPFRRERTPRQGGRWIVPRPSAAHGRKAAEIKHLFSKSVGIVAVTNPSRIEIHSLPIVDQCRGHALPKIRQVQGRSRGGQLHPQRLCK